MEEPLTTAEAARRLGVTTMRVRQLIAAGLLPATRFGRDWAIPAAAVDSFQRPGRGRPRNVKAASA